MALQLSADKPDEWGLIKTGICKHKGSRLSQVSRLCFFIVSQNGDGKKYYIYIYIYI